MLFRFMPLPYVNTTTGAEPSPDAAAAAPYRGPTIILRPGQKLMDGAAIGALQSVAPLWCETHFKVSKSSVRPLAPTATSSTSPFGSASEFAAKRLPSDALDHTMVPRWCSSRRRSRCHATAELEQQRDHEHGKSHCEARKIRKPPTR
jgi:hypothetical protein